MSAAEKNKKNIIGFMMGREALRNPDCFIKISNSLRGTSFKARTSQDFKEEFEDNCKLHLPKAIYIQKIQKYCPWAREIKIDLPPEELESLKNLSLKPQRELYSTQTMM